MNPPLLRRITTAFKAITGSSAGGVTDYPPQVWDPAGSAGGLYGARIERIPNTNRDYAALVHPAHLNAVLSIGLSWLSDNFSEPPLRVSRESASGEENFLPSSPLLDLLNDPNPYTDSDALFAGTVLSYVCAGNAYWIKVRGGSGTVQQLWWAPHDAMRPGHAEEASGTFRASYLSTSEPPTGFIYTVNGRRVFYPREDVVHFKNGLDPANPYLGLSQLAGVWREIYADNQASTYTAALLANFGAPSVILQPKVSGTGGLPITITPDQRDKLKTLWLQGTTGDAVGLPIVPSAPLEILPISHSPEEMTLDKIRMSPEARLCAALGIPAQVLGVLAGLEHSTFANYQEAQRIAYRNGLFPLWSAISRTVTRQLLKLDFGGLPSDRAMFDTSDVEALSESADDLSKRIVEQKKAGILTINEGRAELGLPPLPDGDVREPMPPVSLSAGPGLPEPGSPPAPGSAGSRSYAIHLNARRLEYEANGNGHGH
jgi:HK97 family phage portal protein